MPAFKAIAQLAPVIARYVQTQAAGTAVDNYIYVNPTSSGEYFEVVEVRFVYDVAGGASAAADVKVVPSGTALASGTTALSAACDLTQTARVPYKATLTSTAANRIVKPGDCLAIDTSGTLTGLVSLVVEVVLKPLLVRKQH
jgi:hypothetical protein